MPNNCIRPEATWISDFITPAFAEMCDIFCSYTPASECAHPLQDIAELAGADIADFFSAIVHSTPLKPSAVPKCSASPSPSGDACESPRARDVRERAGGSHDPCSPPSSLLASAYEGNREEPPMAPAMLAGHDAPFFHVGRGDFGSGNVTPLARSSTFNRTQHTPSLRSSYVDTRGLTNGGADSAYNLAGSWNPAPQPPLPAPTPTAAPLLTLANEPLQIPSIQVCERDGAPHPPAEGISQTVVRITAGSKFALEAPPTLAKSDTAERFEDAAEVPVTMNVRHLSDLATRALEGWPGWQGTADDSSFDSSEEWAALASFAGDFTGAPVAQVVASPDENRPTLDSGDEVGDSIQGTPVALSAEVVDKDARDPALPVAEVVTMQDTRDSAADDAAVTLTPAECADAQESTLSASAELSPLSHPAVVGAEAPLDTPHDFTPQQEVCIIDAVAPAPETVVLPAPHDDAAAMPLEVDPIAAKTAHSLHDDEAPPALSDAAPSLEASAPSSVQDILAPFEVLSDVPEAVDATISVSAAPRVSSPAEACSAFHHGPASQFLRSARPPLPPSAALLISPTNVITADIPEEGVTAVALAPAFPSSVDVNQSAGAGFAWGQMHPGVPIGLGETLSQQDLVAALWGAHSRGEIASTTSSSVGDPKMTSHSRSDSFSSDCSWVVVDSVP